MDVLIIWDQGGTHADVLAASVGGAAPRGARRLQPDEEYCAIPYAAWRARIGRTVDVAALQAHAGTEMESVAFSTPTRRLHWSVEPEVEVGLWPGAEYRYHAEERWHECTRDELAAHCAAKPTTARVWTPESGGPVPPEAVPFLVDALAAERLRVARRHLRWSGAGLAVTLAAYAIWIPDFGFRSVLLLVPALLAMGVVGALTARRDALRTDASAFPAARAWARHAEWIKDRPAWISRAMVGLLAVVFLVQMFNILDVSIEMAGLVKPAVWNGEVWRLLTATLLHGNGTHIWMNCGALLAMGHLIEVHSRRDHLPLVFLVSALAGSVASVLLYPTATSVGASGGLMGFTGFLLVLGHRRRDALPPGFAGLAVFSIGATAALGVVGFAVIDNAAHLGGLVAGAVLGLVLDRGGVIDPGRSWVTRSLGIAATLILVAGAVWAIAMMSGPEADARWHERWEAERAGRPIPEYVGRRVPPSAAQGDVSPIPSSP